jgi:CubicO group peptidase (beta-lactamase class C family)
MPTRPRFTALPVLLALCVAVPAASQTAAPPPGTDALVREAMRAFEVPGLALTIVKDGRVVLARGYGVRELGSAEPVDSATLFGIASNTKAFTATALGMLVEEGKLEWDRPVVDYLPWFRLSDPWVTSQLTVRDLLVHRSGLGLGAGDLLWWPESDYTRAQVAARLRYLPLATSFRSAYAYDNVLYLVAGEVIEAVSGMTWEDFVTRRILQPAGMSASLVRHSAAAGGGNVAHPHARVNGRVVPVRPFTSDVTNPAGGVMTGASDMARWLILQLDSGRTASGTRLFTPATTRELWSIVTPLPIGEGYPELAPLRPHFSGYALGFFVRDYRGQHILTHTGGLPGYVSRVVLVPELNLGIAILTSQETPAQDALAWQLVDFYLHAPHYDWLGAYRAVAAHDAAEAAEAAAARSLGAARRDAHSAPSLLLASYAGTYRDAWYGDVVVQQAGSGLSIRFSHTPALHGELVHWQHDTFVAHWADPELRADAFVSFTLSPDGRVAEVRMAPASPEVDFSYDFQDLRLMPVR